MAVSVRGILISQSGGYSRNSFLSTIRYFAKKSTKSYRIGDEAELRKVISVEDVEKFAHLSGDVNPIHLDNNFAKKTSFGQIIVHGVILNGYFSFHH